jgi:flavin-dependent dehydrogenase
VAGRVLLVGDAAGYVDAVTGEGIAVALACGRALVECIAADDPAAYEKRWLRASRRYRTMTSSLLWARRQPVLASRIVPLAARLPWIFGAAVHQLAR